MDNTKIDINAAIHNRFDIEVKDSITGKIKQKATAFNVICDTFWTRCFNFYEGTYSGTYCKGWRTFDRFGYIVYGRGSGTPSSSDTTLFNKINAYQTSFSNWSYDETNRVISLTRSITINADVSVGETITEVGLSYDGTNIVTHAMLTDINGNIISIQKTNVDIITIYATVYAHWSSSYQNGSCELLLSDPDFNSIFGTTQKRQGSNCYMYSVIDGLIGYMANGSDYYNTGIYITSYKGTIFPLEYIRTVASGVSIDANNKIINNKYRFNQDYLNYGGVKYFFLQYGANVSLYRVGFFIKVSDNGGVQPSSIQNEALGSGDAVQTNFKTAFPINSNLQIYIDGVQNNNFSYRQGPTSQKDMFFSYNRIEIINNAPVVKLNTATTYTINYSSTSYLTLNGVLCMTLSNRISATDGKVFMMNCIIENPYNSYIGISKMNYVVSDGNKNIPTMYMSNDGLNWIKVADPANYIRTNFYVTIAYVNYYLSYCEIPQAYRRYRYIKYELPEDVPSTAYGGFEYDAPIDSNVYFNTPPGDGSIITANYKSDYVGKDVNHLLDLDFTVSFNEY